MKVKFADSFWQSLKDLNRHGTWWYKTYHLIRYNIPTFIKNVWKFRQELWEYTWWDYQFTMNFMRKGITDMAVNIERSGLEVESSKIKKVNKMIRAAMIMNNILEDKYLEMAEKQLGLEYSTDWDIDEEGKLIFTDTPKQRKANRKIFLLSNKIQEEEWKEMWEILKGQDHKEYQRLLKANKTTWDEWYDGSGMNHWWD
jgi:hypothetical protein